MPKATRHPAPHTTHDKFAATVTGELLLGRYAACNFTGAFYAMRSRDGWKRCFPDSTLCRIDDRVLFPALIERNITESVAHSGYGHSHGLFLAHESYQRLTLMPLIMVPMCFHAVVEGVLLGLEASVAALMGSAVPLLVHRFFDGVVVGVCIAKEVRAEMEAVDEVTPLNATEKNTAAGDFAATFRRHACRFPIILWLCIMPTALLFCVVLTGDFHVHGVSEALHRGGLTRPSDGAESHLRGSWHKGSKWLALTQAVGSGFFLYAGLTTLTLEELKGTRASLALFAGVLFTSLLGAMETH
ncbi:hypothetical protein TcBrA4_0111910 [Trypanosoma cruzi]|nr:hypothetical protein TcBrA4_0111910 [Trypanosoma cruzi]